MLVEEVIKACPAPLLTELSSHSHSSSRKPLRNSLTIKSFFIHKFYHRLRVFVASVGIFNNNGSALSQL